MILIQFNSIDLMALDIFLYKPQLTDHIIMSFDLIY